MCSQVSYHREDVVQMTKSSLNPILYCQKGALIRKLISFLAVNTKSTTWKVTLSLIILQTHQLFRDRVDLLLQVEQKFSVDPPEGRGGRGKRRRREKRERKRRLQRGREGWREKKTGSTYSFTMSNKENYLGKLSKATHKVTVCFFKANNFIIVC